MDEVVGLGFWDGFLHVSVQRAHDAEQLFHLCQYGVTAIVCHCSLVATPSGSVISRSRSRASPHKAMEKEPLS